MFISLYAQFFMLHSVRITQKTKAWKEGVYDYLSVMVNILFFGRFVTPSLLCERVLFCLVLQLTIHPSQFLPGDGLSLIIGIHVIKNNIVRSNSSWLQWRKNEHAIKARVFVPSFQLPFSSLGGFLFCCYFKTHFPPLRFYKSC